MSISSAAARLFGQRTITLDAPCREPVYEDVPAGTTPGGEDVLVSVPARKEDGSVRMQDTTQRLEVTVPGLMQAATVGGATGLATFMALAFSLPTLPVTGPAMLVGGLVTLGLWLSNRNPHLQVEYRDTPIQQPTLEGFDPSVRRVGASPTANAALGYVMAGPPGAVIMALGTDEKFAVDMKPRVGVETVGHYQRPVVTQDGVEVTKPDLLQQIVPLTPWLSSRTTL